MADRMARLNALAQGGTAGLAEFDRAQQSVAQNNKSAIDQALGYGGIGAPQGAQDAAKALIGRYTQHYTKDAATARENAGQQVGFDKSALDSFLAQQQKRLDASRSQAEQGMELDRLKFDSSMESMNRRIAAANAQRAAQEALGPLAGLSETEVKAKITGQALREQAAAIEAEKQRAAAEAQNNMSAQYALQGQRYGQMAAGRAGQPATGAAGGPSYMKPGAAKSVPGVTITPQERMALSAENATTARQNQELYRIALAQFQQNAAVGLGMDPDLARGLFPVDEVSMAERQRELAEADNLQADLTEMALDSVDKELQADLMSRNLSYSRIKSIGNGLGISAPAAAAIATGENSEAAAEAAAAADSTDGNDTADKKFAWFSNVLDETEGMSLQEKQFWKEYYRNYFYASPTLSQLDNAALDPVYTPNTGG